MIYLPTWMLDFYGIHVCKSYQVPLIRPGGTSYECCCAKPRWGFSEQKSVHLQNGQKTPLRGPKHTELGVEWGNRTRFLWWSTPDPSRHGVLEKEGNHPSSFEASYRLDDLDKTVCFKTYQYLLHQVGSFSRFLYLNIIGVSFGHFLKPNPNERKKQFQTQMSSGLIYLKIIFLPQWYILRVQSIFLQ